MNKITVSIGIPAFNEEANIGNLIRDILKQVETNYVLREIVVYSDGSTDKTVEIVKRIKDSRLNIVDRKVRKGLAFVINQIIRGVSSDALILINADQTILDKYFVSKLINVFNENNADLIGCMVKEIKTNTFTEKVILTGMKYKTKVFLAYKEGNNVYTCHGHCRLFSKRLYKSIKFKKSVGEDMYSYLYCIKHNFVYKFAKNAVIYYKLPDNLNDHEQQSLRFYRSKDWMMKEFGKNFVAKEASIPKIYFAYYALTTLLEDPFYGFIYFLLTGFLYVKAKFNPMFGQLETWRVATSSKTLKNV